MAQRGVLYMVWGDAAAAVMQRSIASVQRHLPGLPIQVLELPATTDRFHGLLEKSRMAALTPFETTLFLDADTVVLGDLAFGFVQAERYGVACTLCECPWARRYPGLGPDIGDLVEYNTGVIFFTQTARPLFDAWAETAPGLDSRIPFVRNGQAAFMPHNDQASFAVAVDATGRPPFVLPLNWNFRPQWHRSFFGPIRIWHDYAEVLPEILAINAQYAATPTPLSYHQLSA